MQIKEWEIKILKKEKNGKRKDVDIVYQSGGQSQDKIKIKMQLINKT